MKVVPVILVVCALSVTFSNAQFNRRQSTRCFNPNQRPGTCVSIYDCQTVMSVLNRQPLQPIDVQFVKSSECAGGYGRAPHICCAGDTGYTRRQQRREEPTFQDNSNNYNNNNAIFGEAPSNTLLFPAAQPQRGFVDRRESGAGAGSGSALLPQPPTCGGVTIENKIYGGSDANLYEFPWMVLLEYSRRAGGLSTSCGGSLINQRYVLTAAHCTTGAIEKIIGQLVSVRLGEHDTTKQIDCSQFSCAPETNRVAVEQVIPHNLYRDASANKENDIALVRLDRNVRFSTSISPICLPSSVAAEEQRSGQQFTVAGWGRTLEVNKSPVKQKLNVALVDQQKCQRKFRESRKVNIVETQLCAGGKYREDSCEGDSGGPLMRFRGGAWVLEGIVSFGYKCGLKDWPAVYTRVASYDNWIRSNMRA